MFRSVLFLAGLLAGAQAFTPEPTAPSKFAGKLAKEAAAKADLDAAIAGLKAQIRDFKNVSKAHNKTADALAKDKALFKEFVHEVLDKAKPGKPVEVTFEKASADDVKPTFKEDVIDIVKAKVNETKADVAGLKKDLEGPIVVNVTSLDLSGLKADVWSGVKNATSKPGKDVIDMLVAAHEEKKAEKAAGKAGEEAADAKLEAAKDGLKGFLISKAANLTKH